MRDGLVIKWGTEHTCETIRLGWKNPEKGQDKAWSSLVSSMQSILSRLGLPLKSIQKQQLYKMQVLI